MKFNQIEYINKFNKENYAKVTLSLKPEYKVKLQQISARNGLSMTSQITKWIDSETEKMGEL